MEDKGVKYWQTSGVGETEHPAGRDQTGRGLAVGCSMI